MTEFAYPNIGTRVAVTLEHKFPFQTSRDILLDMTPPAAEEDQELKLTLSRSKTNGIGLLILTSLLLTASIQDRYGQVRI